MLAQRGLTVLFLLALLLAGCGDPCTDLSKKICKCKPTAMEQQSCTQAISDSTRSTATKAEQETCSNLLDTCSCDKLEHGDLAACGLSEE
jgi:hypothetical protein